MEFNKDLLITLIGYFLAIFFNIWGLIYGAILYVFKRNNEMYYEHSRNIMAIALGLIIIKLFIQLGHFIF